MIAWGAQASGDRGGGGGSDKVVVLCFFEMLWRLFFWKRGRGAGKLRSDKKKSRPRGLRLSPY